MKKLIFLLICNFVFLLGVHAQVCQRVSIPSYFYPGSRWTQAINSAPKVDFMLINPNSGSGTSVNSDYVSTVNQAKSAGIKIYGYVSTSYGNRSLALITQDIDNYRNWYQVDGIFLDETPSTSAQLAFYQQVANYIRTQPNSTVILNPGVFPDEAYMNIGDIVVVFEDKYSNYLGIQVPAWVNNYSPNKFWHIIHSTTAAQSKNALSLSKQRRAGHIYITGDKLPNPYDTLPSYWSSFISQISPTCP
jgi:Spherulation-specific family 4